MYQQLECRRLFSGFSAPVQYALTTAPNGSAIADINNDGRPDMVITTLTGAKVLLGTSGGGFTAAPGVPGGRQAGFVAIADVNGDGRPDIVAANPNNASVAISLGRGKSKFAAWTYYSVGSVPDSSPAGIVATDLNHDGKPDIAVSDNGGIKVLINHGDGTFDAARTFLARRETAAGASRPGPLAAADLDGDGFPDLVGGHYIADVPVFFNAGDGTFARRAILSTHGKQTPLGVATADFNRDHKPDVVVVCREAHVIQTFLNTSGGTFAAPKSLSFDDGVGGDPEQIAIGDFNADHRPDLAISSDSSQVLLFNGSTIGTFKQSTVLRFSGEITDVLSPGDLNADLRGDLITTGFSQQIADVFLSK